MVTTGSFREGSFCVRLPRRNLKPIDAGHYLPGIDAIACLCGQPDGPLYCYGSEEGIAMLCEVGHGRRCELERLDGFMSIEQINWSGDRHLVALADLSERIYIKRVENTGEIGGPWQVHDELQLAFPSQHGHID
jgi:hypothetical protein